MANGHSWSNIKKYTLAEIGTFFKTVVLMERSIKAEKLTNLWYANNVTQEGLQHLLKNLGAKEQKKVEPSDAEVKEGWNKLAGALRGLT